MFSFNTDINSSKFGKLSPFITNDGITIADDYAHHPKELEVTLKTAMNMGYKNVYDLGAITNCNIG